MSTEYYCKFFLSVTHTISNISVDFIAAKQPIVGSNCIQLFQERINDLAVRGWQRRGKTCCTARATVSKQSDSNMLFSWQVIAS